MASNEHSLAFEERGSYLNQLYPLVKLIWVVIVAAGLFLYRTPRSGAIMFTLILLLALIGGKIPFRQILNSSRLILGLGLVLMFFHFFADPGEIVYKIGPLALTDNGLHQGPIFFFRLSVVVLASFLLIWTTDARDLMVSLAKAGLSYRMAFTVFLAMRFLPLIQREVDAVRDAHAIRGRASNSSLVHRFKLWQRYIFTILVNGLRKAEITATSLDCRAFGYAETRTYLKEVFFKKTDLILVIFTLLLSTLLVVWERMF
jgi:energy-coupling factor transport system permease protein